jgi:hypothetical protein
MLLSAAGGFKTRKDSAGKAYQQVLDHGGSFCQRCQQQDAVG